MTQSQTDESTRLTHATQLQCTLHRPAGGLPHTLTLPRALPHPHTHTHTLTHTGTTDWQTAFPVIAHNLLKHIYTAHPPKKSSHVLKQELKDSATVPGPGKEAVRKGLVRASLSYHPDHNKEYGVKWLVLCEEIQKKINEYVTALKDLS